MPVLSGNRGMLLVARILASLTWHGLPMFYRETRGDAVAARLKFLALRIGDAALISAAERLFR
jgi:hypothetical protein